MNQHAGTRSFSILDRNGTLIAIHYGKTLKGAQAAAAKRYPNRTLRVKADGCRWV